MGKSCINSLKSFSSEGFLPRDTVIILCTSPSFDTKILLSLRYVPLFFSAKKRDRHAQNFLFHPADPHAIHNHFPALSSLSLRLILSAREKLQKLFFLSSLRTLHQQEQKYFYRASCF